MLVTVFLSVVLATWTLFLVVETVRAARMSHALDKAKDASDRTIALADEYYATAKEHDRVSAEGRKQVQELNELLAKDIERERDYNTEFREKLEAINKKYQEHVAGLIAKWERSPTDTVAEMLAKMIAEADTDDGTETVRRLLSKLHGAWPEHEWAELVSEHSENPARWGSFTIR